MLTHIIGYITAALFVLVIWQQHRISGIEKKLDRMEKPWNERKRR